jgi:hypothetical protein
MTSRDFCYWLQGYLEIGEGRLTLIRQPNDGPRFSAWASSVVGAAGRLRDAERAAKRARK